MIAIIPILCIVLGALAYGLSANPKVAELGRLTFLAGVLVACYLYSGHTVHVP